MHLKTRITTGDLTRAFALSESSVRRLLDRQTSVEVERIGIFRTIDRKDLRKIERLIESKGYRRRELATAK